ncbi:hypothetical protein EB001_16825 [bacterium]|nr:hypothetical protein [bacterium]
MTVPNPGGRVVKQQFRSAYSKFFSGQLINQSFKKAIAQALSLPSDIKTVKYSFSPNVIQSQASAALSMSFGGVL